MKTKCKYHGHKSQSNQPYFSDTDIDFLLIFGGTIEIRAKSCPSRTRTRCTVQTIYVVRIGENDAIFGALFKLTVLNTWPPVC